jgi:hypothetical protein
VIKVLFKIIHAGYGLANGICHKIRSPIKANSLIIAQAAMVAITSYNKTTIAAILRVFRMFWIRRLSTKTSIDHSKGKKNIKTKFMLQKIHCVNGDGSSSKPHKFVNRFLPNNKYVHSANKALQYYLILISLFKTYKINNSNLLALEKL